jgi:hypothetical protein
VNKVILMMDGGHTTMLAEQTVSEVERSLVDARENALPFVYFQSPNIPDNGFAVDPTKVVAVTTSRDRGY